MAGLLDEGTGWDIDPAVAARMAASATAPPADVTIAPSTAQPATMADAGGGLLGGARDVISNIGLALGGNVDPAITGEARSNAGIRSLLNFSLAMLANSGPSYTPRNFGQILASGLSSAAAANQYTEEQRLKASQVGATLALKAGQMKIQELLAGIKGAEVGQKLGVASKVSAAAAGGDTAPAAGDTVAPIAAPASAAEFVSSNAPVFQDIAARTGLPVEFVAGQAGNESAWGTSPAAVQGNNLFGIKDPATGKPAVYPSKQAGVDAYVTLLNSDRYKSVPRTGTPAEIGGALGKAGYAVEPDYGQRIGNFATQAAPLLPRPTGTQVAGPGAGAGAPSGGGMAPAPSSPPPSPGAGVVGPPAAEPPATVNAAPPAPIIPRATLPPPDFSDIPGRRASVDAAYRQQLANVANSGDPNLRATAEQERRVGLAAVDKEVADRKAAYAKEAAEFEAKQNEAEAKLVAENARHQATIDAEDKRADLERKNKLDLAEVQANQNRLTNKEQTVNQANLDGLKQAQKEQFDARDVVTQLEGFRALSDNVGQPGWLQTTKLPGSDVTIAEQLQQAGYKLDDTAGVQLLRGGMNGIVKSLRQGMAMGTLSDRDLNFIQRMGPTEWMDRDTRTAAVSYLQQAYQAKQKFASDVQKEMSRGRNFGDAVDVADKAQKPFVPTVPQELTDHWTDPGWQQQRLDWTRQEHIVPGTLFHLFNGRVVVMKGQR